MPSQLILAAASRARLQDSTLTHPYDSLLLLSFPITVKKFPREADFVARGSISSYLGLHTYGTVHQDGMTACEGVHSRYIELGIILEGRQIFVFLRICRAGQECPDGGISTG